MSVCFLTFDVEDWFQVENLRSLYPPESWERLPRRVAGSTRAILDLLEELDVPATFFVLGWIADREPELVRAISRAGHEVGSHGYGHLLPLTMTEEAFREDARRAQTVLQELSGRPVIGYRAPSFNLDAARLDILADLGFRFDSSHHDFRLHDRYAAFCAGHPVVPGVSALPNGMYEFPLPTISAGPLTLPVSGGGYFRLYPGWLFRAAFRRVMASGGGACYFHSWEFDPCQPSARGAGRLNHFRHSVGLRKTLPRLRAFIAMLRENGVRFSTMGSYLTELRLIAPRAGEDARSNCATV